jgi:carboxymethylenebutenolidase
VVGARRTEGAAERCTGEPSLAFSGSNHSLCPCVVPDGVAGFAPLSLPMKRLLLSLAALAVVCSASAQDWAKARFEKTPRHNEWVKVKNGAREVNAFITYPEVKNKATTVIVIHENQGLTDWARSVTDQLAEAGYIAIAPDFLSGMGPNGGGTSEFPSRDAVGKAFQELGSTKADQVTGDLKAIYDYVAKLPASNGKVVVGGFCWGGAQTFRFATNNKDLKAALVFYGSPPKDDDITKISVPVYGFYGGNDARINATIPKTVELMKAAGKKYEPVTYEGAGHGFMRAGEDPGNTNEANKKARDEAWVRVKAILAKI